MRFCSHRRKIYPFSHIYPRFSIDAYRIFFLRLNFTLNYLKLFYFPFYPRRSYFALNEIRCDLIFINIFTPRCFIQGVRNRRISLTRASEYSKRERANDFSMNSHPIPFRRCISIAFSAWFQPYLFLSLTLSLSLSLSRKSEKASKLDLRPLINLIIAFFFFCLLSRKKDDQRCLTRFKNPTNRVIVVYTRVSVYSVVLFRPRFEIIRGRWWIDDERWFSFFSSFTTETRGVVRRSLVNQRTRRWI